MPDQVKPNSPISPPAPGQRRPRKNSAWTRQLPWGVGIVLAFSIIYGLLPKAVPVESAKVVSAPLTVSVLEEGKTRIRHRYMISPPVSGYLKRIELRAGDKIEVGKTVLAHVQAELPSFLNPRALAETEARVKAAQALVMRNDSEVERMRSSLDLAKKDLTRAAALKNTGAISVKEWDMAETQVQMLGREVRGAEFAKQVAEFELAQAQAALKQYENPSTENAEPMKIIAPVSGYVLNVMEENSRIVAAGTPIMEVGDPRDLEAEIELLSSDAVGVQPDADVSIEQWGGDHPLKGKVTMIEPAGFTKVSALGVEEQRVKVRVNFSEPLSAENALGDRFRVEARIVTWSQSNVLQVPTGALFRRGGDWICFVIESGKARAKQVAIGHNNGIAAEVKSGLTQGEVVILHPPDAVTEGKAVKARKE